MTRGQDAVCHLVLLSSRTGLALPLFLGLARHDQPIVSILAAVQHINLAALSIAEDKEIVAEQLHLLDRLIAEHWLDLEFLGAHDPRPRFSFVHRHAIGFHPYLNNL